MEVPIIQQAFALRVGRLYMRLKTAQINFPMPQWIAQAYYDQMFYFWFTSMHYEIMNILFIATYDIEAAENALGDFEYHLLTSNEIILDEVEVEVAS
jgi:hypothetical protein